MNQLKRLEYIMRAKVDPRFFLYSNYFLRIPTPYPLQEQLFVEFFTGDFKEFVGVGGMGGGKTFLGSLFGAYDLFDLLAREDPAKDYGLASHSPIFILCIAKSDEQASDTIFNELQVKVANSPFFQEFNPRIREYSINFRAHPDIEVLALGAASISSSLGRNVKSVLFDEICSYDETKSQRGAWQVYTRLRKSTNRFGFKGHIASISSPWHVNDIIMTLARRGKMDAHTLVKEFTTWDMNPNKSLDSPEMQAELAKDPITFWRDYGIKPHSSVDSFYPDLDVVLISYERDNVLEPLGDGTLPLDLVDMRHSYILSIDPGTNNCAFGLALLHMEVKKVIADGLWRIEPKDKKQIDPTEIKQLVLEICKRVPVRFFVTDQWTYQEMLWELQKLGIQVHFKPLRKEEHDAVRNAWYEKKLELCNYPYILEEFSQLLILDSRRIGIIRGGKIDVVDALTRGYWAAQQHLSSSFMPNVVEII